jgi:hypothetical protein
VVRRIGCGLTGRRIGYGLNGAVFNSGTCKGLLSSPKRRNHAGGPSTLYSMGNSRFLALSSRGLNLTTDFCQTTTLRLTGAILCFLCMPLNHRHGNIYFGFTSFASPPPCRLPVIPVPWRTPVTPCDLQWLLTGWPSLCHLASLTPIDFFSNRSRI